LCGNGGVRGGSAAHITDSLANEPMLNGELTHREVLRISGSQRAVVYPGCRRHETVALIQGYPFGSERPSPGARMPGGSGVDR